MEEVKLPDLNRIRAVKQRLNKLPPQKSATDTSNWEGRNVSAITFDTENKKHKVRVVDFLKTQQTEVLTEEELKKRLKAKGYTTKQIQQKIEAANKTSI